jgi:hypothetical protein
VSARTSTNSTAASTIFLRADTALTIDSNIIAGSGGSNRSHSIRELPVKFTSVFLLQK